MTTKTARSCKRKILKLLRSVVVVVGEKLYSGVLRRRCYRVIFYGLLADREILEEIFSSLFYWLDGLNGFLIASLVWNSGGELV